MCPTSTPEHSKAITEKKRNKNFWQKKKINKLTCFAYSKLYEKAITRAQYPRNKVTALLGILTLNSCFKSTNDFLLLNVLAT